MSLKTSDKLNRLPELKQIQPLKVLPTIDQLPRVEKIGSPESFFADYNNATEINSFADTILNAEAKRQADWGVFNFMREVPIINTVPALVELVYKKGIKPALKGDFKAVGINTLVNIGETLDVVANPIKGMLLEKDPLTGLARGLGIGKDGRVNYDFDTGSWVADIALEIVADPLNWLSLGSKELVKQGVKAGAKELSEEITTKIAKDVAQKIAVQSGKEVVTEGAENIVRAVTRKVSKNTFDIVTEAVSEQAEKQVNRLIKAGVEKTRDVLLEEATETILTKQRNELIRVIMNKVKETYPVLKENTYEAILKQTEELVTKEVTDLTLDAVTNRITKSLAKVYTTTESFERTLLKSAFATSGLGLSWKAASPLVQHAGKFINTRVIGRMKAAKFIDKNNVLDIFRYDEAKARFNNNVRLLETIDGDKHIVHGSDTFMKYVSNQLVEDTTALLRIHTNTIRNATERLNALENYIKTRYPGKSLTEYVDGVKHINTLEGNIFKKEVAVLERLQVRVKNSIVAPLLDKPVLTLSNVYNTNMEQHALNNLKKTALGLRQINALAKDITSEERMSLRYVSDTVYRTIKTDEAMTQISLLEQPALKEVLYSVSGKTDNSLGRFIDNVLSDPRAIGSDIYNDVKRLKTVTNNALLYREFVEDVLNGVYSSIPGVSDKEFRSTLLNTLYSHRHYSAMSTLNDTDLLVDQLFNLTEEAINSQRINQARKYIPLENKQIFKEQLKRYAEAVISTDPNASLVYPLATDYTNLASKVAHHLERVGIDNIQLISSIKEVADYLNSIKEFNNMRYVYNKTLLESPVAKEAFQEVTGAPTVLQALQKDLEGSYYLGEVTTLNTSNFKMYFTFESDTNIPVILLQRAEHLRNHVERAAKKYVRNDLFKTVDNGIQVYSEILTRLRDMIVDVADKAFVPGATGFLSVTENWVKDTEFLDVLRVLNIDELTLESTGVGHLYAMIEYISNWAKTQPLKKDVMELISPKDVNVVAKRLHKLRALKELPFEDIKQAVQLLKYPNALRKQVIVYNPQVLIRSTLEQQFQGNADAALKSYARIDEITKNVTNEMEALQSALRVQEESPNMLTLYNKYSSALKDVTDNIFTKTKEKIYSLYDSVSADKIREEFLKKRPITQASANQFDELIMRPLETFLDINAPEALTNEAFQELRSYAKRFNIDLNEPYAKVLEYNKLLTNATDTHLKKPTVAFLTLNPEDMQKELIYRNRVVRFNINDWKEDKQIARVYKDLLDYKAPDYKQKGIHFIKVDEVGNYVVILDKTIQGGFVNGIAYLNGEKFVRPLGKLDYSSFKTIDPELYEALERYQNYLEEITGINPSTSVGDVMDENTLKRLYNGFSEEEIKELNEEMVQLGKDPIEYHRGLPDEVKNLLPSLEELSSERNTNRYIFNESILGSATTRRSVTQYFSDNLIKNLKNNMEQIAVYADTKATFIHSIAGSQFSINKGVYKNFSDQSLLQALQSTDRFKLITVVEDPKYGVKIKELLPLSEASIAEARKLNAVIVPKGLYTTLINKVNHRLGSTGFFKYWNRIMYLYKFGYLMNIGTVARNYADTNLKTALTLGSEARNYKQLAHTFLQEYHEITKLVADRSKTGKITAKGIQAVFAETGIQKQFKMDAELYEKLTDFFMYGPVDNITEASLQKLKLTDLDFIGKDNWRTFTHYTSKIMSWANQTEDVNRLALYLESIASGATKHDAWERIAKVHFDYKFKTPVEQLLETVLPFSTFAVRNTNYWVEMMLKHPHYAGLFRDVMTPVWDLDHYTKEELQQSWSLQYQIINGNINLFNRDDKDYVLRLNPSIMDATNILTNPIQAIQNRVSQPIQNVADIITGRTTPSTEMLPVIGTLQQRFDKMDRERNVLPALMTKRDTSTPRFVGKTTFKNKNLLNYTTMNSFINPQFNIPRVRTDVRIDPYKTIGVKAYSSRMMPNPLPKVYNKTLYKHKQDVYGGIRYSMRINFGYLR